MAKAKERSLELVGAVLVVCSFLSSRRDILKVKSKFSSLSFAEEAVDFTGNGSSNGTEDTNHKETKSNGAIANTTSTEAEPMVVLPSLKAAINSTAPPRGAPDSTISLLEVSNKSVAATPNAVRNEREETMYAASAKTAATATMTAVENEEEDNAEETLQRTQNQEAAPLVGAVTQPVNQVEEAVPSTSNVNSSLSSMVNVLELSKTYQDEPINITAAICFKTMFGDIDLGLVLQWVAYNRLLGFDHVFMFYRPEMTSKPRFAELAGLPYVTMTEYTKGNRKSYYNQRETETMCLSEKRFAADYDWALLADIDEFLWFSEKRGIKPFLAQQQARNLTYLSFGKYMYTLNYRADFAAREYEIDTKDMSHFPLSKFPFYIKNFCYGRRIGEPLCPTWRGRAKVIVMPKHHKKVDVHGTILHTDPAKGTIHFHPDTAHFLEWPHIFGGRNITLQEKKSFKTHSESQVGIHNLERAFKHDAGGNHTVRYDHQLEDWFQYVIGRGTSQQQGQQQGRLLK